MGGGKLGCHVAAILSQEKHNVILIDSNPKTLQEVSANLDVATRQGSGADWQLLEDLQEFSPDLFLALSGDDEANLVSCLIAKQLQYPRTIARVHDSRYLIRSRLDFGRIFDIDYFIGPELLVANDIMKYITSPGSLAVENFSHGALQLRTILIPSDWHKFETTPIKDCDLPENIIVGLIRREVQSGQPKQVIFPHGEDTIMPGDEVTFIGVTEAIAEIHKFFGIEQKEINSAVIVGGTLTGYLLAEKLQKRSINVRMIEKDHIRCTELAERLPGCTIMHHDGTDLDFLLSEKIGSADILIAAANKDETNLLVALLGKEIGCNDVMLMLTNTNYAPLVTRLGLKHVVSPRISATNHILSQLLSGKINSLISLYENEAEIMEINVSMDSKIVGIPLSELGPYLPQDLLIVMIQNRGRVMIARGNRIISPGDTVIVVTSPRHIDELGKIF